jgi:Na+/proline symporter
MEKPEQGSSKSWMTKRRRASTFSAIASPVSIYFGAIFITGSLFLLTESGLGPIVAAFTGPPGLVMFIIPLTANMHKREKWQYAIVR